jgi:hypothetical protein
MSIDQKTIFREFARIGGRSGRGKCKARSNAREASAEASKWRKVDAANRITWAGRDRSGFRITGNGRTFFVWHVNRVMALLLTPCDPGTRLKTTSQESFTPRGKPRIGCWEEIDGKLKRIA